LLNFFLLYAVSGWMFMQRIWTPRLLAQGLMWAGGLSSLVGIGQFLYAQFGGAEQVIEVWRQMIVPFFLGPSFGEVVVEYSSWAVNLSGATVFRAIAVFPDPHIAAFFWGLCLPWALAVAWKERSVVGYILSGIICIALLLTFSRGTYFALVIVGMVATGMATMNLGVYARRATIFVGIVGCALLFIPNNPIIDRALSSFSTTDGSNQGRWEMWEYAVESIWEQPWGVGIGNYATYILPSAEYRTPIYAHNTYLDIAAETGVLTLVVWLVWIINTQLRAWMYRKQDAYLLAVVGSLALFSTHAFFDTPLYSVHVLPILLLIIASVESTSTQSHRS